MSKNLFEALTNSLSIEKIHNAAFDSGFASRMWQKISPEDYFKYICFESTKGTVSHNDLSERISLSTGNCASRQAYWERTKKKLMLLCKRF